VRELRNEEGYQILTHNDKSELKPGQYVLFDAKPKPAFQRDVSKELRSQVLDRNGYTCQMCGAVAGEQHPYDTDRKTRLHIGHIVDKSVGGTDELSNLRAICSICNEGAANTTLDRPSALKLLVQLRRLPRLSSWRYWTGSFASFQNTRASGWVIESLRSKNVMRTRRIHCDLHRAVSPYHNSTLIRRLKAQLNLLQTCDALEA
jgi:5-methylcytosine-specific restriction endonuclease McrA